MTARKELTIYKLEIKEDFFTGKNEFSLTYTKVTETKKRYYNIDSEKQKVFDYVSFLEKENTDKTHQFGNRFYMYLPFKPSQKEFNAFVDEVNQLIEDAKNKLDKKIHQNNEILANTNIEALVK